MFAALRTILASYLYPDWLLQQNPDAGIAIAQLAISVGVVLIQWATSDRSTRTWRLLFLRWFVILTACFLCALSISRTRTQQVRLEEQDRMLNKIGAATGDPELMQHYLALEHQMNVAFARTGTDDFAKSIPDLLASVRTALPERRAQRSGTHKAA